MSAVQPVADHSTQAIILAAGQGMRLRPLTDDRPKCMVPLLGKPLLNHQLDALQAAGFAPNSITVVTGYRGDVIQAALSNAGVAARTIDNPRFASTNMVSSLMVARSVFELGRDVVILYADLVYEARLLQQLLACPEPFAATVDSAWRKLWGVRNEDPLNDAETLKLGEQGQILELGKKPTSLLDIEGQYMGIVRVRASFAETFLGHYDGLDRQGSFDGKDFDNMYMTSFLQSLIDAGQSLQAVATESGWLEVDTTADLELYERLAASGELDTLWRSGRDRGSSS